MLLAPELRICASLGAATENGVSCRLVSRFCAVTMISRMTCCSVCCALATGGSSAIKPAAVTNILLYILRPPSSPSTWDYRCFGRRDGLRRLFVHPVSAFGSGMQCTHPGGEVLAERNG